MFKYMGAESIREKYVKVTSLLYSLSRQTDQQTNITHDW